MEAQKIWDLWTAMWNGAPELAAEIIGEGFYVHLTDKSSGDKETIRNAPAVREWVKAVRGKYEAIRYRTNGRVLVDGDTLAARWLAEGTHVGGAAFQVAGTDVLRVANGRIIECWTLSKPIEL